MRTLLFAFALLFVLGCLGSCNNSVYYHNEPSSCHGRLSGSIKRLTDSTYLLQGYNEPCLARVVEYEFDSLQRLISEKNTMFYTPYDDSAGVIHGINIKYSSVETYKYNVDGRRIARASKSADYENDTAIYNFTDMRVTHIEGDTEKWKVVVKDSITEGEKQYEMDCTHSSRQLAVSLYNFEDNECSNSRVYTFDDNGYVIESLFTVAFGTQSKVNVYDDNGLLVKSIQILFENDAAIYSYAYGDFDDRDNWRRCTVVNKDGIALNVVHRKIEYRD